MDVKLRICWISVVLKVLVFTPIISRVTSDNPEGFISIDCGGVRGEDPVTGLEWETDEAYLQAWSELSNSSGIAIKASVNLPQTDSSADRWNERQLGTAMVFYPGAPDRIKRSKFCYMLPVVGFNSSNPRNYLLRATFPTGKLKDVKSSFQDVSWDTYSARFYYTVDSTYIATIELQEDSAQIIELIVSPLGEQIYVCLVPLEDRSSMPAISALELRRFDDDMYTRLSDDNTVGSTRTQTSYLINLHRWNLGGSGSLRYPGDPFDRLWSSPPIPGDQSAQVVSRSNTTAVEPDSLYSIYRLPSDVLSSAWVGKSRSSAINLTFDLNWSRIQQPTPTYYYTFSFYDILGNNQSLNQSYSYVDDNQLFSVFNSSEPLDFDYSGNKRRSFASSVITFTFTSNNLQPPLISSAEMYGEFNAITRRSYSDDAGIVYFLAYNNFTGAGPGALQLDMSGDPCLPVPWAWLSCSVELPPRVTKINLTAKGLGGTLPEDFGKLYSLTILDLSHNNFTGQLPESLGNISSLQALNLQNNKIFGRIPNNASWKNVRNLSLANNQMTGDLSSLFQAVDASLTHLDVSNNSFNGILDATFIAKLVNLKYIDLSNNQLSGELNFSMFSSLNSLSTLRKPFTTVNLTTWYESVKKAKSFEVCGKVRLGKTIKQLYLPAGSLDHDPIINKPSDFEKVAQLANPTAFILVDPSSPWCLGYKHRTKSLLVRYLCRKNETEDFWPEPQEKNDHEVIIIVSVLCGVFLLFTTCVFAYLLWRTRKHALELQKENERRNREIEELQKELESEDLSPPFFKYEDLAKATNNFSEGNLLGRGGFGTVYKAVYPDKDPLAVKVLRPDEKNAEFLKSEFLKEIKSITGIQHKNLIHLKGYSVGENSQRILVYQYAENRSLAEALWDEQKDFSLTWKQRFNICLGIARGLAYLHEDLQPARYHRDIKPQNILLVSEYNAKIADFGLTRLARPESITRRIDSEDSLFPMASVPKASKVLGTWGYMSPESLDGSLSQKNDVYSFGVVLLEIVSGRKWHSNSLPADQKFLRIWAFRLFEEKGLLGLLGLLDKELLQRGDYNEEEVLLVLHMALASCQDDPEKRPTMTQIVHKLMKHESSAINIIPTAKAECLKWEDIRGLTTLSTIEEDESQDSALLSSTAAYLLNRTSGSSC